MEHGLVWFFVSGGYFSLPLNKHRITIIMALSQIANKTRSMCYVRRKIMRVVERDMGKRKIAVDVGVVFFF